MCIRKVPPKTAENKKVYHENGSVPVVHTKHQSEWMKNSSINYQAHFGPQNGIRSGHQYQIQSRMQKREQ